MKLLGLIDAPEDLVNKQYVDDSFGKYFESSSPDTLTFDGNVTGLEGFSDSKNDYYKISDATPSYDELNTAYNSGNLEITVKSTNTGVTANATSVWLVDNTSNYGYTQIYADDSQMYYASIYIYYEGNSNGYSPGVYVSNGTCRLASLTIQGYGGFGSVTKLKSDYIPSSISSGGSTKKKVVDYNTPTTSYLRFNLYASEDLLLTEGAIADVRFFHKTGTSLYELTPANITILNEGNVVFGFRSSVTSGDIVYAVIPDVGGVWSYGM